MFTFAGTNSLTCFEKTSIFGKNLKPANDFNSDYFQSREMPPILFFVSSLPLEAPFSPNNTTKMTF